MEGDMAGRKDWEIKKWREGTFSVSGSLSRCNPPARGEPDGSCFTGKDCCSS